jgi:hypothetical protein
MVTNMDDIEYEAKKQEIERRVTSGEITPEEAMELARGLAKQRRQDLRDLENA